MAIDLSITSLAYAKRKTIELGISNIEYFHGDINTGIDKKFDVIESVGVLHHMKTIFRLGSARRAPQTGGLMRIGLYSELARREIVPARIVVAESGISVTK